MQNHRVPPSITAFFPDSRPIWPAAVRQRPALDRIDQIAFLVEDRAAAIEDFGAVFGWGPFYPATARGQCDYRGRQVSFELALAFTMVGDLEIELVQPLTGDNPYRDQLRETGAGFFHLRFATDEIEQHLERLGELGIEPVSGWREGRWITANVDSHRHCGVRAELILGPDKLAQVLAALGRRGSVPVAQAEDAAP